ncbi:hypothetical protein HZB03_02820 [Candidatus Woesearchaeota archaeon]|nr:hypothetical protein [Candidatus Woesearchaeota archaeon]
MKKKGDIWIAAILYILIITVVLTLVLQAGVPIINDLQDKTTFTRSKNTFLRLNQQIVDISQEGAGSQRVIPIEVEKGDLELSGGSLKWDLRTGAKILEPGQEIDLGNLFITSNADVAAGPVTSSVYTLQNSILPANFTRCEDRTTCTFASSNLLQKIRFRNPDTGAFSTTSGTFNVEFGQGAWNFSGFSKLEDAGDNLGSSSVLYYVNNTNTTNSTVFTVIEFTLGSNRDFVTVKVR